MKTYSRLTLAFLLLVLVVPPVAGDKPKEGMSKKNRQLINFCKSRKVKNAKEMIERGADVNAQDVKGSSPLMIACRGRGSIQLVHFLLTEGANVNAQDAHGQTPLILACRKNRQINFAIVSSLLSAGADPKIQDKDGHTAIDLAYKKDELEAIIRGRLSLRRISERETVIEKSGGSHESEASVAAALQWLAKRQNKDGSWSFSSRSEPGNSGVTGLALLPFLAAGYTHQPSKNNNYASVIKKGVDYILANRDSSSGRLFERNWPRGHFERVTNIDNTPDRTLNGLAACALAEAYELTHDAKIKLPAEEALRYIARTQEHEGGWSFQQSRTSLRPSADGSLNFSGFFISADTSTTGWQICALANDHDLLFNAQKKTSQYLDKVGYKRAKDGGWSRYGYMASEGREDAYADSDAAMTAIGLLCQSYFGRSHLDLGQIDGAAFLSVKGPSRQHVYYNYFATMAMFELDGPDGPLWEKWNATMHNLLINSQVKEGNDTGSWHFARCEGFLEGRLMSTCLCALMLEVYYRYKPFKDLED